MKEKKVETFIYEDFGFPIELIDVPMKKVLGEWILDINLGELIESVLRMLIHKPTSISGNELRFIRKYLEMTSENFGNFFGITSDIVQKWESEEIRIPPTTEKCIRMYALERLHGKDDELLKLYREINIEKLATRSRRRHVNQSMKFSPKKTMSPAR